MRGSIQASPIIDSGISRVSRAPRLGTRLISSCLILVGVCQWQRFFLRKNKKLVKSS
jgi:hypothetical protein